jgi:hypothetical protein
MMSLSSVCSINAHEQRCSLAAKQQAEGLRVDYLPIILDIGMLDPVFQWALSMNSEEHRACIEVLKAIAEAAPLMAGAYVLTFICLVPEPCGFCSSHRPVRSFAAVPC